MHPSVSEYDKYVCAEIPDPALQPRLHHLVTTSMLHGPCKDTTCKNNPEKKCTKNYPKQFSKTTHVKESATYVTYRRRAPIDGGREFKKNGVIFDNRHVVPYNPFLLLKYECHINVEISTSLNTIKYLFKYLFKGDDLMSVRLLTTEQKEKHKLDEVARFLDTRFITPDSAGWGLAAFKMHDFSHTVTRLTLHLPGLQRVLHQGTLDSAVTALERNSSTQLTSYFAVVAAEIRSPLPNKTLLLATKGRGEPTPAPNLSYLDFPLYYTFSQVTRTWSRRKRYAGKVATRMFVVSPTQGELYYLRVLLNHTKGAASFEALRTIDGVLHPTFQSACIVLGLLQHDAEWAQCLRDASDIKGAAAVRSLFIVLLAFCTPSDPLKLWSQFGDFMSEDYAYQRRGNARQDVSDSDRHRALSNIRNTLAERGLQYTDFNLPLINNDLVQSDIKTTLVRKEEDYMTEHMSEIQSFLQNSQHTFNREQKLAFDTITNTLDSKSENDSSQPNIFFVNASAGTGKTTLAKALIAYAQTNSDIAVACASSGLAAILYTRGTTTFL